MPWRLAKRLITALNDAGAESVEAPGSHPAEGATHATFLRYVREQWTAYWTRQLQESGLASSGSRSAPSVATTGRPEQARRLDEMLRQLHEHPESIDTPHSAFSALREKTSSSLGYVTVDECPGQGDDTRHTPIPFSLEQPDYVAADPETVPGDDDYVDVVFVDFILKPVIKFLNAWSSEREYTHADALRWGNVTTQWLYPVRARQ